MGDEIREEGDLYVDNAPCEVQLVVDEGVATLGIVPDALPPDPLVLRHVEVGSWADSNGIRSGDELMMINGMRSADLDGIRQLDKLLRKERPLSLTFLCRKDGCYHASDPTLEFQRASTFFIEDFSQKSRTFDDTSSPPKGRGPEHLVQQMSAIPAMPSLSWLVIPKADAATLVCEFVGAGVRVGCCKPCSDRVTRGDCTVHIDGAKLLDELVEPVENYSSLVPMPSLCPYTDEDCLSDSGHACNLSDDECMHEVQTVDEPPRADDVAADKEELAITPVPYDEAKSDSHQGAVTRERGMHGATGRFLRWLRSDPARERRRWPAQFGKRRA